MPPKKAQQQPSKKTEQKKKDKIIEDKTFGLKNKKGAKQQKFIQQVQKQVTHGTTPSARKQELLRQDALLKKKGGPEDPLSADKLFKPVQSAQKVEKGTDPKSVLCVFFKQGQCTKGDKCKFSHDLTIERKSEKRSLYCDERDENDKDTMDQWDDEKLKEVVEKKHGEAEKSRPKTDIICKYFLNAVEQSKYGWFWECPNGDGCHYRHALPPGFVLKKDQKKAEKKDEISLEELIERERAALGSNLTPVTLQSFIAWKKRKIFEKKENIRKTEEKKQADFKAGKHLGLSGRDMFTFNPAMAADSDELEDGDAAFDTAAFSDSEEKDENDYKEINFENLDSLAAEELEKLDLNANTSQGSSHSDNKPTIQIDEDLFDDSEIDSDDD